MTKWPVAQVKGRAPKQMSSKTESVRGREAVGRRGAVAMVREAVDRRAEASTGLRLGERATHAHKAARSGAGRVGKQQAW